MFKNLGSDTEIRSQTHKWDRNSILSLSNLHSLNDLWKGKRTRKANYKIWGEFGPFISSCSQSLYNIM